MPKVSFVVPTKNRVEWLAECLVSLLGQSVSDIEVVVVDDGSTDDTEAFMEDWACKDSRVVYIRNEVSEGAGPSRNKGAQAAKADIICIMDDDDAAIAERAELAIKWFQEHPDSELVNFPYVQVGYCNNIIEPFYGEPFDEQKFKETGEVTYFANPTVAVKKASLLQVGGYPKETPDKTDDVQFVTKWIESGKKIDFCPGDPVLLHRVLPKSMMANLRGFRSEWVQA